MPGVLLRLGHVRLVERVDAKDGARDGGGELPAEELAAQPQVGVDLDLEDWVAGSHQLVDQPVGGLAPAHAARQEQAHEDAVGAVDRGGPHRLAVDGHDAHAVLPGALRDQLLDPCAERGDGRVGEEGQLVAPGLRQGAERHAEGQPRVLRALVPAALRHADALLEHPPQVDPQERRGHAAHVGQCAVPAADVGRVQEHLAELVVVGDGLHAPAGIGDRREVELRPGNPPSVGLLVPERRKKAQRLRGRAGFRRDQVQGGRGVERLAGPAHRVRVGRVEDVHRSPARRHAVHRGQHVGGQGAAAHPAEHGLGESLLADSVGEGPQLVDVLQERLGRVQPAQAVQDLRLYRLVGRPE